MQAVFCSLEHVRVEASEGYAGAEAGSEGLLPRHSVRFSGFHTRYGRRLRREGGSPSAPADEDQYKHLRSLAPDLREKAHARFLQKLAALGEATACTPGGCGERGASSQPIHPRSTCTRRCTGRPHCERHPCCAARACRHVQRGDGLLRLRARLPRTRLPAARRCVLLPLYEPALSG